MQWAPAAFSLLHNLVASPAERTHNSPIIDGPDVADEITQSPATVSKFSVSSDAASGRVALGGSTTLFAVPALDLYSEYDEGLVERDRRRPADHRLDAGQAK
jgi:hypothetical protein